MVILYTEQKFGFIGKYQKDVLIMQQYYLPNDQWWTIEHLQFTMFDAMLLVRVNGQEILSLISG